MSQRLQLKIKAISHTVQSYEHVREGLLPQRDRMTQDNTYIIQIFYSKDIKILCRFRRNHSEVEGF